MKNWGIGLIVVGALILFISLGMETGIASEGQWVGSTYVPSGGKTLNIGLLQKQNQMFFSGIATMLGGIVLLAAGLLGDAVRSAGVRFGPPALGEEEQSATSASPLMEPQSAQPQTSDEEYQNPAGANDRADNFLWGVGLVVAAIVAVVIVAHQLDLNDARRDPPTEATSDAPAPR